MTLTPERWQRERDVLHRATQMDEEEHPAFLKHQCNGDTELRNEVEKLLVAEGELGSSFRLMRPIFSRKNSLALFIARRTSPVRSSE